MPAKDPTPPDSVPQNPTLRSFISLAIVLHLLCVLFVLAANVRPSGLQQRLAGVLAPYTQALHLDPGGARLQFTDGTSASEDYVVSLHARLADGSPDPKPLVEYPLRDTGLSPEKWRWLSVAFEMGAAGEIQRDDITALYAKRIGYRLIREQQATGDTEFDHGFIRCRRRMTQPLNLAELQQGFPPDDPDAPPYYETLYEAEVFLDEDGQPQAQKRSTGAEVAPSRPTQEASGS